MVLIFSWVVFYLFQSPDGDLIDCVLSHHQPAFDHPQLKGKKPLVLTLTSFNFFIFIVFHSVSSELRILIILLLVFWNLLQDPPDRPKGQNPRNSESENFQLWSISGESCPEGTIPIRRTREEDILRANSVRRFGRKARRVRRDSTGNGHEVSLCQKKKIWNFWKNKNPCKTHVEIQQTNKKEGGQRKWKISFCEFSVSFFFLFLFLYIEIKELNE